MYKSPIEVYIEQAVNDIAEQRDNQICSYITEKFDVQVDREELIKALQYDRAQYEKGYKEGAKESLDTYQAALLDTEFLKYNYGIKKVDAYFISYFGPEAVVNDYKEWKSEQRD